MILLLIVSPVFSQVENTEEDEIVENELVLKSNEIPAALKNAVDKSFKNGTPIQWYSFPYVFKEYGWAFKNDKNNMSSNSQPELYDVQLKTAKGSRIDAVFTKDGKLIRSKEVLKNIKLPSQIVNAVEHSEYKNYNIIGDRFLIKNAENNTSHYSVIVKKGNKKHTLYFDKDGNRLRNSA